MSNKIKEMSVCLYMNAIFPNYALFTYVGDFQRNAYNLLPVVLALIDPQLRAHK